MTENQRQILRTLGLFEMANPGQFRTGSGFKSGAVSGLVRRGIVDVQKPDPRGTGRYWYRLTELGRDCACGLALQDGIDFPEVCP